MSCLWAYPGRGGAGRSPAAWWRAAARRRAARGPGPRLSAAGSSCTRPVPSAPSPALAAPAHTNNNSSVFTLHTGSMTFWCLSGSAETCLWLMDPDSDPDPPIFVTDIQDANKKLGAKKAVSRIRIRTDLGLLDLQSWYVLGMWKRIRIQKQGIWLELKQINLISSLSIKTWLL